LVALADGCARHHRDGNHGLALPVGCAAANGAVVAGCELTSIQSVNLGAVLWADMWDIFFISIYFAAGVTGLLWPEKYREWALKILPDSNWWAGWLVRKVVFHRGYILGQRIVGGALIVWGCYFIWQELQK
jgi:hypothetical protein